MKSFERFGDDLTELILSYLPFEDKLSLECVSKQWQQLIYQKVFDINVLIIEGYEEPIERKINDFVIEDSEEGFPRLECLLKKLPNLRRIELNRIFGSIFINNINKSLFEVMVKFCPLLRSLSLINCELTEEVMAFLKKSLGPKIRDLKVCFTQRSLYPILPFLVLKDLLNHCLNIETFVYKFSFNIFKEYFEEKINFLPKLKSLVTEIDANDVSVLQEVCHKYSKQLKTLKISTVGPNFTSNHLSDILKIVAILENITELEIDFKNPGKILIEFERDLKRIQYNCKKLKRFSISMFGTSGEGNVVRSLKGCDSLKELRLEFGHPNSIQSLEDIGLKRNIKHLYIKSYIFIEHWFASLQRIVPNLQTLELESMSMKTDNHLILLSRLKSLRVLKFFNYENGRFFKKDLHHITDSGVKTLLDNCPELRIIEFDFLIAITNKTIENLIAFAMKRPKQMIIFRSKIIENYAFVQKNCPDIDVEAVKQIIPENLNLFFEPI